MKPIAALAALLLAGCSAFNTVPLHREATPYPVFLGDRQACLAEASRCIAEKYATTVYDGEYAYQLYPSRGVYMACMTARGYFPLANGYLPPVLARMTDYRPGWDCFGR